jgi:hypothetical protein
MVDITPLGGRGISVNPEGTDYPFVDPNDDVRGILADAFLAHEVSEVQLPLHLFQMTNFDAALPGSCSLSSSSSTSASSSSASAETRADVIIKDASGKIICDTSYVPTYDAITKSGYRQVDFGTRFRIHEWVLTEDVVGNNKAFVCRVVQHTAFEDDEDVHCIPNLIQPENSVLDARVSQLLPKRIRTITVNTTTFRGNVALSNGYNTFLFRGDDTRTTTTAAIPAAVLPDENFPFYTDPVLRQKNRITLSASPGDGLGTFPGCPELDVIIRRMNGVSPQGELDDAGLPQKNAGNFLLAAEECYFVRQPTTLLNGKSFPRQDLVPANPGPAGAIPAPGFRIGNDCGPCCECVEFARTYKAMRRLWNNFKELGVRAEATRDLYKANMDRWISQKECREGSPLRLATSQAFGSGTLVVSAAGAICNSSDECITDVDLKICFVCGGQGSSESSESAFSPSPGPLSCNTNISTNKSPTRKPYRPEGDWPCYTFHWSEVDPGRSVNFKMDLQFDCDAVCSPLTAVLTGTIDGEPISQILSTNMAINCGECA